MCVISKYGDEDPEDIKKTATREIRCLTEFRKSCHIIKIVGYDLECKLGEEDIVAIALEYAPHGEVRTAQFFFVYIMQYLNSFFSTILTVVSFSSHWSLSLNSDRLFRQIFFLLIETQLSQITT